MKCQILFSGKNKKKYFNMSIAENFTQSVLALKSKWTRGLPIITTDGEDRNQSAHLIRAIAF